MDEKNKRDEELDLEEIKAFLDAMEVPEAEEIPREASGEETSPEEPEAPGAEETPPEELPAPEAPGEEKPDTEEPASEEALGEQPPSEKSGEQPPEETKPELPELNRSPNPGQEITIPIAARKAHKNRKWLKTLLLLLLVAAILGGGVYAYLTLRITPVDQLLLGDNQLTLRQGESFPLHYELIPYNADDLVEWSSSNTAVATVDKGVVQAVGAGTCTVTALAQSGAKDRCYITVRPPLTEEESQAMGTWELFVTSQNGQVNYYYGKDYVLQLYSDRTGYLDEKGEKTQLTWEFDETINGNYIYIFKLKDNRKVQVQLNDNTNDVMYNTLSVQFVDGPLWMFMRKK